MSSGEWVPVKEPGVSDVIQTKKFKGEKKTKKWITGLRWEKIDENLILRHVTSKRNKKIEIDLKLAPMVMEEFQRMFGSTDRAAMPASGPVILCEVNAWPYYNTEFRRKWRKVANAAGIPKNVKNMDTRSGAITEAARPAPIWRWSGRPRPTATSRKHRTIPGTMPRQRPRS
jgi:hypothetical protein